MAAVGGSIAISFAGVLFRASDLTPVTATLYRGLFAIPLLALLWWWRRNLDDRPMSSRIVAFAAGIFFGLDLVFWHSAIDNIGVGLATVLIHTQVIFVGAIAWVRYGEKPTTTSLLAVPVVLVGIVLISGLGAADAYGEDPWLGVLFAASGGLFYALFLLLLRESNRGYLVPPQGPLLDATLGVTATGLVAVLLTSGGSGFTISASQFGWLILMMLTTQVVGWLLIAHALPRLPALDTSIILLLQPVFAATWAMIFFDERFSATQWVGVALVLGGVVVINARGAVEEQDPAEAQVA